MASYAILSNFFEEQWTQNHPQYFSGSSRELFPTTFLEIAVCCSLLFVLIPWRSLSKRRNVSEINEKAFN